jgi:hypothetical protein
MPSSTDLQMQASFDLEIAAEGEAISCYAVGSPPALLGTTSGMFQFNEAARDVAMGAGVDPGLVAQLFTLSTAGPLLRHRGWVKDTSGTWWLIDSAPVAQPLGGIVIGVNVFVTRQVDAPVGA